MSIEVSNSKAKAAADKVRDAIRAFLDPDNKGVWGVDTISNVIGAFVLMLGTFPVWLFGSIFALAADLTSAFLDGITEVRESNREGLNTVLASSLTEVLGVPVSGSDLPASATGGDNVRLYRAIGEKVLSTITRELGGTASDTPGPGEAGASGFLGFGLGFAVNAGLLSIVGEVASLGFIKAFSELPEEIQRTLGFGRLMRQAIQPLIHALVAVPYTRELNARYTPSQLTARELLAAFNSGRMQEDEMRRQMAQHGYKDGYIDELLLQLSPRLSLHEVDALVRWGDLDEQRGIEVLQQDGVPAGVVRNRLAALHRLEGDRQEHAYADEVLKLAQGRFVTPEVFSALLARLHMSDEVKQVFANRLGVYLDSETKRLTLKELLYLHEHSLITLADIDRWAEAEGYNEDAHAMLDLWLTQQELDFEATKKHKAARAAGKATKKQPTPPPAAG